jgi:predicted dehydrogenase
LISEFGPAPGNVVLFGGGRWSRVLLDILNALIPESTRVHWITRHNYSRATEYVKFRGYDRVLIYPQHCLEDSTGLDAAIIATASEGHASLASKAVGLGIPTLCEKPVALKFREAKRLADDAKAGRCPLGVNLELMYASYLHDFSAAISDLAIRTVKFTWHDPWVEKRHGEIKHGDLHTPIVHDSLPHCWSLSQVLFPSERAEKLEALWLGDDGAVHLKGQRGAIKSNYSLSRRSARRIRKIEINDGEAVLDFSQEPGRTIFRGAASENLWRGPKPLSAALGGFLEVVRNPSGQAHWPLSIHKNLAVVELAEAAARRLKEAQLKRLEELRQGNRLVASDPESLNLLLDFFLPIEVQRGTRLPTLTPEEQRAAAQQALNYLADSIRS